MVDYSKWSRFEVSDSDEEGSAEEEQQQRISSGPRVTRLGEGDRVQLGPSGAIVLPPSSSQAAAAATAVKAKQTNGLCATNGAHCEKYSWSQVTHSHICTYAHTHIRTSLTFHFTSLFSPTPSLFLPLSAG